MGEFGDKFRKEREKQGISLDDVSNVTKIGSRMLKAIEDEHFDQLPGGVFNKGFIRAYAKHLGMNDDDAIAGYLAVLRQAQIDAQAAWEPERPAPGRAEKRPPASPGKPAPTPAQLDELPELQLPRAEHARPPRTDYLEKRDGGIPWRILALALLVIFLVVVLWMRHWRSARVSGAGASPAIHAPAAEPAPTPAITNQPSAVRPARPAPATSHPSPASTQPATTQPAALHSPVTVAAKPAASTAEDAPQSPETEKPAPSAPSSAPLTLVIRASETSWISVVADGRTVSQEMLIAPAHTSIHASREIVVRAGNAAGVTFLWNGQEIPAQGAEAEVKTFVFDADGMRVLTPPQPTAQPPAQNP